MSKLKVLVVGASIAGPATAYWLAKAGASVTVIERFPQLRTNGHNIDIRDSGVTVMRRMPGMEAAVRAKLMGLDGLCFVREDGRPYGTIRASGNPGQQSILSEYEIFRGELAKILFDLTKDNENITYVFDEQIASIQQDEKIAKVEFTKKLPPAEYDLVVACDGATSRTRAMALNCSVRDHIRPSNCWAIYFSTKHDMLDGTMTALGHTSIPGRFMSVEPGPKGGNIVQLMAINPRNGPDVTAALREATKQGDDSLKQYVANYFSGHGWRTKEVLQAMMEADDLYASEIVQVKVPHLHQGRFVLVGDAGYAPGFAGRGTTLALTGAYVLAGEICKHGSDLKAGLEGYETTMRPMIDEMSKVPPLVPTFMAPQTSWGLWLRNIVFTIIARSRLLELVPKLFGALLGNTREYPLPDYEWKI